MDDLPGSTALQDPKNSNLADGKNLFPAGTTNQTKIKTIVQDYHPSFENQRSNHVQDPAKPEKPLTIPPPSKRSLLWTPFS
jgi:hypothetical protein